MCFLNYHPGIKEAFSISVFGIACAAVGFRLCFADNWNFNASNPCLHVGGNYYQNRNLGLFYVNYNRTSNANDNIGCRILSI